MNLAAGTTRELFPILRVGARQVVRGRAGADKTLHLRPARQIHGLGHARPTTNVGDTGKRRRLVEHNLHDGNELGQSNVKA